MNIGQMDRKDFESLPHRNEDQIVVCSSLIILPTDRIHRTTGYKLMDFVAVVKGEPLCLLGGYSDVLHVKSNIFAWSVECLPNGFLHIWPMTMKILCGHALSFFEVAVMPYSDRRPYTTAEEINRESST